MSDIPIIVETQKTVSLSEPLDPDSFSDNQSIKDAGEECRCCSCGNVIPPLGSYQRLLKHKRRARWRFIAPQCKDCYDRHRVKDTFRHRRLY
jgi:hypothetical protein